MQLLNKTQKERRNLACFIQAEENASHSSNDENNYVGLFFLKFEVQSSEK